MDETQSNIVLGLIGHVHATHLQDVKVDLQRIPNLKIVFLKESGGKLWIVESEAKP